MTTKIIISLCCLIAFYSMSSCTKDEFKGPPGPPGDTGMYIPLKGDINGTVAVYDSLGRPLTDYSGVQVIIDSLGTSTMTDTSGAYFFHDVPAGRYNFSFKKNGYGTYRIVHQLHPGGPQATHLVNADVGKIYDGPPVTHFELITIGTMHYPEVFPYVEFASPYRIPVASVIYVSNRPDVSATNSRVAIRYPYNPDARVSELYYQTDPIPSAVIQNDTTLLRAALLYMVFAFDNVRDIHYIDEEGHVVYPCTGKPLATFSMSPFAFQYVKDFPARKANDGVYPLLRKFRLR